MNLNHLAPDIQEALLFLPAVAEGRDAVTERSLRAVLARSLWPQQRKAWQQLASSSSTRAVTPHLTIHTHVEDQPRQVNRRSPSHLAQCPRGRGCSSGATRDDL